MTRFALALLVVTAGACASGEQAERPTELAAWFDCLRESGGVAIAAHRGGPSPGYPENALETLQVNFEQGLTTFEVDVSRSRDGVLFLAHDRTFGRTIEGDGIVEATRWDDIADRRLIDNGGQRTTFRPPSLDSVLDWAVEVGALVELDRKSAVSFESLIAAVREANAEQHVVLITYSDAQAAELARLAPDLMMTASASSRMELGRLVASGVDPSRLIVWAGTSSPNPGWWNALAGEGIEPAFGTLGRPGQRLDDRYAADGDLSEYQRLVEYGMVLLATDTPLAAADALTADEVASEVCSR